MTKTRETLKATTPPPRKKKKKSIPKTTQTTKLRTNNTKHKKGLVLVLVLVCSGSVQWVRVSGTQQTYPACHKPYCHSSSVKHHVLNKHDGYRADGAAVQISFLYQLFTFTLTGYRITEECQNTTNNENISKPYKC